MAYSYSIDPFIETYKFEINNFFRLKYIFLSNSITRPADQNIKFKSSISKTKFIPLTYKLNLMTIYQPKFKFISFPLTSELFKFVQDDNLIYKFLTIIPANKYFFIEKREIDIDPKYTSTETKLPMFVMNSYNLTLFGQCWEPFWFDLNSKLYLDGCAVPDKNNYSLSAIRLVFSRLGILKSNISYLMKK